MSFPYSITNNLLIKLFILLSLSLTFYCQAKEYTLSPEDNLQQVLDESQDGDVITLSPGKYIGNFIVERKITLRGNPIGNFERVDENKVAIIDAQNKGHALQLKNAQITIEHLIITHWGNDVTDNNSGIYSDHKIANNKVAQLTIRNNLLIGSGVGIWLNHVEQARVKYNDIKGNPSIASASRGNGIQLSNSTNSVVFNNNISGVRDGIYVISSQNNIIKQNTLHHLRYGIHYMYSEDDTVINNVAYNTRAGYALMSSKHLTVTNNETTDSEDYGFLMNFVTESTLSNNKITGVWSKPENQRLGRHGKGLFVYHSSANTVKNNIIDTAEIGIHLTAGSEKMKVYGNSFINNPIPVKYVSTIKQEWSFEGRGNYWSNYLGWDINNDGIGDTVFEPNDSLDKLMWQYPEMKVLMDSPALLLLRWVQRQFPVLKPSGIKDSYPLMHTPFISNKNNTVKKESTHKSTSKSPSQDIKNITTMAPAINMTLKGNL